MRSLADIALGDGGGGLSSAIRGVAQGNAPFDVSDAECACWDAARQKCEEASRQ
jgi:hypothetical protein